MAQDQFLPGPGSTSQTIIVTGVRDGYQIDATSTATRTPTELNDVANAFISGSGSADTYGAWYVDADISQPLSESVSTRMNAVYEEFRNNRDFYDGRRVAINPTVALSLGGATRIDLGFEYNSDKRTIDRGVPSAVQGSLTSPSRPLTGARDTFFGVPGFNVSDFEAKVLNGRVEHRFSDNLTLTSRVLYGDYDKLYRNAFPVTPVTSRGGVQSVGLEAYSDPTTRKNLLNQN